MQACKSKHYILKNFFMEYQNNFLHITLYIIVYHSSFICLQYIALFLTYIAYFIGGDRYR